MSVIPMLVGGLALVILDFRTAAPDLLPDIVGWGLIVVAALRLALTAAACLAAVAGLASLVDTWMPYRHIVFDPVTGEPMPQDPSANLGGPAHLVYDDVTGWRLTAIAVAVALAGLALSALVVGIAQLVKLCGRAGAAKQFRIIGWLIVPVWTVPYLAAIANAMVNESGAYDPVWNGGLVYVWLVGFALFVYLVVLLVREHDESWTRTVESPKPSPWEELRARHPRRRA